MKVGEIMKKVFVVEKNISLKEAARIMSSKNIGSILVVDGEEIKGILTEKDLVENFGKNEGVFDVMSGEVKTISSKARIDEALSLMRDDGIKRVPVVDGGEIKGIVTITDIAANAEELEEDFFFG